MQLNLGQRRGWFGAIAMVMAGLVMSSCGEQAAVNECGQTPAGKVNLPSDDSRHSDPVEWWYWTGHLQADDGRWFGFEEVFFRVVTGSVTGQMAHQAITDVSAGTFGYNEEYDLGEPAQVPNGFQFSLEGNTAVGGGGHDVLHAVAGAYTLDVQLDAVKNPVLQPDDGYTDYSFGGFTYYYSRERMAARGTITVAGQPVGVTGTGWFDHQWGDLTVGISKGWDWFALQLDDNREIMLFVVRVSGTPVLVGGSYSDANCHMSKIAADAFTITPLGSWTSPHSGSTYPSGWTIVVAGMTLTVTPVLPDQELVGVKTYWEGAALVTGDATGRAYIELTGY